MFKSTAQYQFEFFLHFPDFNGFQNVNELPSYENAAGDLDNLDDLLQYIGHTR